MARQTPILIKSFPADTAIAGANLALVTSNVNPGNVMLPAAARTTKFIGVSNEPSANDATNALAVMVAGIAQIQSDGSAVITAGDDLEIANAAGQVRTVVPAAPAAPGVTGNWVERQIIGKALSSIAATAGLLVDVLIQPMTFLGA